MGGGLSAKHYNCNFIDFHVAYKFLLEHVNGAYCMDLKKKSHTMPGKMEKIRRISHTAKI